MKRPIKMLCQIIWNYYKYKEFFYNFNALNRIFSYFYVEKLVLNKFLYRLRRIKPYLIKNN